MKNKWSQRLPQDLTDDTLALATGRFIVCLSRGGALSGSGIVLSIKPDSIISYVAHFFHLYIQTPVDCHFVVWAHCMEVIFGSRDLNFNIFCVAYGVGQLEKYKIKKNTWKCYFFIIRYATSNKNVWVSSRP